MIVVRTMLLMIALLSAAIPARAQDKRQNRPGQFDFYVLSLSWSPSFCLASTQRGHAPKEQCGSRPFSFVVHGLWPQYEKGFPEFCQVRAPRLSRDLVASMLDIMPAPGLIFHEWERHGTCSGLNQRAYFQAIRKARALVKIPEAYLTLTQTLTVTPKGVEDEFIKVNPGLGPGGIAVTCNRQRLSEVRICLSKDLRFRNCPEIDRRSCRRKTIVMPPVREAKSP